MITWLTLKQFTQTPKGVCVTTDLSDTDVILINHDYYNHLEYDAIEYVYNNGM